MKYKLHKTEHGDIQQCDSCGCEVPTALFGAPSASERFLCEFCSTTMTSRYTEYPTTDQWSSLRQEIWLAAASVFNMLKHGGPR